MSFDSVSSIDGRYIKTTAPFTGYFSERALIKYRIIIEVEYLIFLSESGSTHLRKFTESEKKYMRELHIDEVPNAEKVKAYEAVTNHDVKAVEYFIKEKLKETSLKDTIEWVHFALTSEDTNNLAYALMLSESLKEVIIPSLKKVISFLNTFASEYKSLPMLARTHGQSASPTTLGKEFKVFSYVEQGR